jgi:hypothetical protein
VKVTITPVSELDSRFATRQPRLAWFIVTLVLWRIGCPLNRV